MKILLVLPAADKYRITAAQPKVPKRAMLRFSLLPLTTVAALTPAGHEVVICDENVQALDFDSDAHVIGISFMTALAPRAYRIAAEFRRRGKITVAGGYHPTLVPEEAAQHFDAVVVGDAEGPWQAIIGDIEAERLAQFYHHRQLPGYTSPPPARRDLMQPTACLYATTDAIQAGRGCIHACRYCSVTAFHRQTYRLRKVADIIKEIETFGRDFIFVDDNIIADPAFARKLFRQLVPLGKIWVAQSSIKIADDPELLNLAYRAGCRGLFIGIETAQQTNLEALGKGINTQISYRRRLGRIRRHDCCPGRRRCPRF